VGTQCQLHTLPQMETPMTPDPMTPDRAFQELQDMIDNAKAVRRMALQLNELIFKGSERNEELGYQGMANRTEVMKQSDRAKWEKMRDEYTDRAREALEAMGEVLGTIVGVCDGAAETYKAKQEMTN
jgi:hypothetical protein